MAVEIVGCLVQFTAVLIVVAKLVQYGMDIDCVI